MKDNHLICQRVLINSHTGDSQNHGVSVCWVFSWNPHEARSETSGSYHLKRVIRNRIESNDGRNN